jgi:hypothetical protein
MSIRVSNTDVALTSQTGLTEQVKPGGAGASGSSPISGKTGEDHLEVSASTENINSALANQSLQHSQKLQRLGNLVAEGKYTVDSADLSRAIVSGAITGPSGEPTGTQ